MTPKRLTIATLTALCFVVPLFAGLPTGAAPFGPNDSQTAAIAAFDPTYPKGQWISKAETTRFYLKTSAPQGSADVAMSEALNGYPSQQTALEESLWVDTQRPLQHWTGFLGEGSKADVQKRLSVGFDEETRATFNWLGWPGGIPDFLGHFDGLSVYEARATIHAETQSDLDRLYLDLWTQDAVTGVRATQLGTIELRPVGGLVLASPTVVPFTGNLVLDLNDGFEIPEGEVLSFDVRASTHVNVGEAIGEARTIYLDHAEFDSHIDIVSDSARLNWWTEDRHGNVLDTFPSGGIQQTEDTRIRFRLIHANMFGNQDNGQYTAVNTGDGVGSSSGWPRAWCNGDNDRSFHCQWDNIDQRQFEMRLRNLDTGELQLVDLGGGLVGGDPGQDDTVARCCNIQHRAIEYDNLASAGAAGAALFTYTFAYNASFPDGPYAVEFRNAPPSTSDVYGMQWNDRQVVHVGGVGFALEAADHEHIVPWVTCVPQDPTQPEEGCAAPWRLQEINHSIAPGERTDYHVKVKNLGSTSDTFGLAVPVPGAGWQATVHPSTVSVPGGGETRATVQVVPPSSALAGDWRAINVVASSLRSDEEKSIRLNTTVTASGPPGVRLTTPESLIEAHAGVPKKFPVSVLNTGITERSYVLTDSGLPEGWRVQVNPPFLSAYPQSLKDATVTVIPPPEARGGESHVLALRATDIADGSIVDEVLLTVRIIIRDGLQITPYGGLERTLRDVGDSIIICEDDNIPTPPTPPPPPSPVPPPPSPPTLAGGTSCFSPVHQEDDRAFDGTVLYRFQIDNTGDREDTFDISASWLPPRQGHPGRDGRGCDGQTAIASGNPGFNDGVPDGWRFRILPTNGVEATIGTLPGPDTPQNARNSGVFAHPDHGAIKPEGGDNAFSGNLPVGQITVPPHSSMEFWIEKGWISLFRDDSDSGECPTMSFRDVHIGPYNQDARQRIISPEASLRLTVRSSNDDTLREQHVLHTTTEGMGVQIQQAWRHPLARHSVDLDTQSGQDTRQVFPQGESSVFQMRATNTGNEYDNMTISLTQEVPGWTHQITNWSFLPSTQSVPLLLPGELPGETTQGTRAMTPSCMQPTRTVGGTQVLDRTTLVCTKIGSFDEVLFNVTATAPPGAQPGDRDLVKINLESKGQAHPSGIPADIKDTILLESIVGGPFIFEARELQQRKEMHRGEVHAFSFSIDNLGLMGDSYKITLREGPSEWKPRLSSAPLVRVPSEVSHHGFLSVEVPADAPLDSQVEFRLQVESMDGPLDMAAAIQNLTFRADVKPTLAEIDLPGVTNDVSISSQAVTAVQGQATPFHVRVAGLDDPDQEIRFRINPATLPAGWELVCQGKEPAGCDMLPPTSAVDVRDVVQPNPEVPAETAATFFLRVPPGELSTSRTAIRVSLFDEREEPDNMEREDRDLVLAHHDVEINLASVFGVKMDTAPVRIKDGGNVGVVPPGEAHEHTVEITNTGLSPAMVALSASQMPQGWTLAFRDQSTVVLGPGQSTDVGVVVAAPLHGVAGSEANVRVFGTIREDPTHQASLALVTRIGGYALELNATGATQYVAPHEGARFQIAVANVGDIRDDIDVSLALPPAFRDRTTVTWGSACDRVIARPAAGVQSDVCRLESVAADAGRVVGVEVMVGGEPLPPKTLMPMTVTAKSMRAPQPDPELCGVTVVDPTMCPDLSRALVTDVVRMEVLEYVAMDVDGDSILEFAVDRNRDLSDGFEEFMESRAPGYEGVGVETRVVDLARFLTDEARQAKMVKVTGANGTTREVFVYFIDAAGDGRADFFLDASGDGLPDVFWDPDNRVVTRLNLTRDVSSPPDGVPEYFIDITGNGQLDVFFDLTTGLFGQLFPRFINEDEHVDYIVDLNHNGRPDDGEPVLFGGPGGIIGSLLMVDVTGDGRLDEVYFMDGQRPYFIPAGTTQKFAITLKDMDGDGHIDWVFDASGDGREDSFYSPHKGTTHLIHPGSAFMRSLGQFWYIGVVFALVTMLFVVLVAVTRR